MIKVNLPSNKECYEYGNGEGCWAECDADVQLAYDNDEDGTHYECVLANDSLYYPGLLCGTTVPIEMRGSNRPVVPYEWLVEHYGPANW